jgi:sodium-independent sulfate anion transporter 11
MRPTLKAIVLDFTTVNHVDLTSVQVLTDVRNQLDRFAAPDIVQWHFANVSNRWTKRALAAAGFGRPTPVSPNGEPLTRPRVFAVGEMGNSNNSSSNASKSKIIGAGTWEQDQDVELSPWKDPDEITGKENTPNQNSLGPTIVTTTEYASKQSRLAPVQGLNYPFFHPDLEVAYESAKAFAESELEIFDEGGLGAE